MGVFETAGFDTCEKYWTLMPNFCQTNDGYKGQCQNGVAHGVGRKYNAIYNAPEIKATGFGGALMQFGALIAPRPPSEYKLQLGMFANGFLDGFGLNFSLSGCGMAGCSGNEIKEIGWFEKNKFKIACNDMPDCSSRVSGSAFTNRINVNSNKTATANQNTRD